MNKYVEWFKEYQKRIDEFPMKFAFTQEALERGMKELGLEPHETNKIRSIGGGGFIRATDVEAFKQLFNGRANELRERMKDDDFMYEALVYELANHEYGYTGDSDDALYSLGLLPEQVWSDENSREYRICRKACMDVMAASEC